MSLFSLFSRPASSEPRLSPITTAHRRELIGMAMQGASRQEKISLARQTMLSLDHNDFVSLVRELDREVWRGTKA